MAKRKSREVTSSRRRVPAVSGFTLIETVVALLIVSLGMTAVFMQLNQFSANAIYMQDKTLASWIGSNRATELSLAPEWPELGEREDVVEFADREWHVQVTVSATDVQSLRRAEIAVSLEDRPDKVINTVSALIEPPVPAGFPPVNWVGFGQGPRG
jgi:general secretion pathway protein I